MSGEVYPTVSSPDVERRVLGEILVDPRDMGDVLHWGLAPADFELEQHRVLFGVMCQLHEEGEWDEVKLVQRMRDQGVWESSGGAPALLVLLNATKPRFDIGRYSWAIRETAKGRRK
jgi:replicative DNA helicase